MNQRIIQLTTAERELLSQILLGYGKLTESAQKTGLHINTLRYINLTGSGKPETIRIIRETLLEVANVQPAQSA